MSGGSKASPEGTPSHSESNIDCSCCSRRDCLPAAVFIVLIGIIIVVMYFWLVKYTRKHDLTATEGLGKMLAAVPGAGATFWEFTHLVLFMFLGFLFPSCDAVIISLGAAWEMVEHFFGLTMPAIRRPLPGGGYTTTQWWYGSAVDIAVNIVGFYIGKSFRLLFVPPRCYCKHGCGQRREHESEDKDMNRNDRDRKNECKYKCSSGKGCGRKCKINLFTFE